MAGNTLSTLFRLGHSLLSHPSYLILYVTNKCDLSCPFCFNQDNRQTQMAEMTVSEMQVLAGSCRHLFELLLSGGEPFLRQDLTDILMTFIRESQPGVIAIPTHGGHTALIEDCMKKILPKTRQTRLHINLSIDDIGSKHDELRGKTGLFLQLKETARILHGLKQKHPNLWIGVNTVVGAHNDDHIKDIIHCVKTEIRPDIHDIGLERDMVISNTPETILRQYQRLEAFRTQFYGSPSGPEAVLHKAVMTHFLDSVQNGKPVINCLGGRNLVTITANGDVYPCEPFWLEPDHFNAFPETCLGNLRDFSGRLDSLLKSRQAVEIIRKIKKGHCSCFWECALFCSILFSPRGWLRMVKPGLGL